MDPMEEKVEKRSKPREEWLTKRIFADELI